LAALLGIAFLAFLVYKNKPGPEPQANWDLAREFLKDIVLLRRGSNKDTIESLRGRIRRAYEERISHQRDYAGKMPYVLAEARILSRLPFYRVHNNLHKQNLINKTRRQGLKLSREPFPSWRLDPRWTGRNIKEALDVIEASLPEAGNISQKAEIILARGYFAMGRTHELLEFAKKRWGMSELTGEMLYGVIPPFLYGLDNDKPYDELLSRRSEGDDIRLERFKGWLKNAARAPKKKMLDMSFSFRGKPLRGVHVLMFPEETLHHIKYKRPYYGRYPGLVLYDWVSSDSMPFPDAIEPVESILPIRWAVSDDRGGVAFGDLALGRHRIGDLMYDEVIFDDDWPNHAPDTSLHDVTFLIMGEDAEGTLPEIRFSRAPLVEVKEVAAVSPLDPVVRWKIKPPPDWDNKPVEFRFLVKPSLTAKRYADEIDVWWPMANITENPEFHLTEKYPELQEGLYRFKVAAVINGVLIDESNTGILIITSEEAGAALENLRRLQSTDGEPEKLRTFLEGPSSQVIGWYARLSLLSALTTKNELKEPGGIKEELLKSLPEKHFLRDFVTERYGFLKETGVKKSNSSATKPALARVP